MRFRIEAGRHARVHTPVMVPYVVKDSTWVCLDDGTILTGQPVTGGFVFVIPYMAAGSVVTGTIMDGFKGVGAGGYGVRLRDGESIGHSIGITINGDHLTDYVYSSEYAKPFLGPVMSASGRSITRLDPDTKEHPHHRSVWFSHGDVNGVDTWNEPDDKGYERQTSITLREEGPAFGRLGAECTWTDGDGRPLLDDYREYTFHNTPKDLRLIDLRLRLMANHGRVVLGATKEAGPLGVRVAEGIRGDAGGTLVNAYGAVGEAECWGRRAPWCDYFGSIDGDTVGVAILDHPDNPGYPSYWHIRDYGLMAINDFYWAGPMTLEEGSSVEYRFRLVFHSGTTGEAGISEQFHAYINPPKVTIHND